MSNQIAMPVELTQKQKKDFEKDGYLVVPGLIDKDLLESVRKGYRRAISGQIRNESWKNNSFEKGTLLQLPGPSDHIEELQNQEHIKLMVSVARQLMGEKIDFWYDQLICKPAGNPWETLWHQDAGYWKFLEADEPAITAWLAVEDVSEDMGCMSFVPGSHTHGRVEHRDASKENPIGGALEAICAPENVVKVPLKAGDVSFHHKNTLHYTSGNSGLADRCGLVNHMRAM